ADGDGNLLDLFLGHHRAGCDGHLLGDRGRHLLANRHRDLLADGLGLVHRAVHVLDDRLRAPHLLFAQGGRALDQAAIDADRLAGDVGLLHGPLATLACDLLGDRPGHADLLADVAILRLGDCLADRLAHGLHRGRLDGPANGVAALLQHGLTHRAADRVRAGLDLGPLDRHLHGVGHGPIADLLDGAADRVANGLVAGFLDRTADRLVHGAENRLAHRTADRVGYVLERGFADRPADVVDAGLDRRLPDRAIDRVVLGLVMGLAHRAVHGIADVLPDRSGHRSLHRVLNLAAHRAVHGPIDRVDLLANVLLDHISGRRDDPWLQDRLADGPHALYLLRLINGLLHVLENRLTLELILDMPTTLLGNWADTLLGNWADTQRVFSLMIRRPPRSTLVPGYDA